MRSVAGLAAVALFILLPTAAACGGLSPGDEVVSDGTGCTLAFLLADPTGLYFATAGHCIQVGNTATNPGLGNFGVGAFHHLKPETGSETDGSPGEDFGLIRIDPEYYDKLNPKVCGWNGPTGLYDSAPGSGEVHHYGYGLLFGSISEETRTRTGYNLINDNTAFYWTGAGVPGDSGSAVLAADGRALGVLTHLVVSPPDTNGGTHLLRGFALAEAGGYQLRLVLMGEDPIQVLRDLQQPLSGGNATPTPTPSPTTTTTSTNPTKPPPGSTTSTTPTPTQITPAAEGDEPDAPKQTPGFEVVLVITALLAALHRRRS